MVIVILNIHFLPAQLAESHIAESRVQFWLTDAQKQALFERQAALWDPEEDQENLLEIVINEEINYQKMDGFGFTLTGGSARLINEMSEPERSKLLIKLFAWNENNIGISYLRISIGASDLSDSVFSYNDLRNDETDLQMKHFSLAPERDHLIPVLKQILEINPDLFIMGSPWSAPPWMKTNNSPKGGSLKKEYFHAYALYFVKYINEMESEGIPVDAITVQNEPLHPGNNPSMYMSPEDQSSFIKSALGPAFDSAGIKTKIIIYDHNADKIDYPISVLNDTSANKYIDGSAFHLYGGTINELSKVHEAHPDKHLYFTEQWIGAPGNLQEDLKWHTENLIIGASRNWCRNVLEWNLAADENQDPHTNMGGCTRCLGAITIEGDNVTYNPAFYIVAHASKFVRPGSVRIESNYHANLPNVAFKTTEGNIVLIVLNKTTERKKIKIKLKEKIILTYLSGGAVGTYFVDL